MNSYIFLALLFLATSTPGCPITTCNAYDSTQKICYRNRTTTGNYYIDIYGTPINNQFHFCPIFTTYCNNYANFVNSTAYCENLLPQGSLCVSGYQCNSGLCVLGKCSGIQGSTGIRCILNTDCEYGLSCVKNICSHPLAIGSSCSYPTYFDNGYGGDINECDYTKKALCGYTGYSSLTYKCIAMFSITDNTYVSNPLLCSTMTTTNGWQQGYCIANRATQLPILTYDTGVKYKKCSTDSDCLYSVNGSIPSSVTGSCNCAIMDANAQSYCNYGGGEPDFIASVAYYEKYWVPQYDMIFNSGAWTYQIDLGLLARNMFNNPIYCGFQLMNKNRSVQPTISGMMVFYSIVAALFLIGFAGVVVVFMMC